MIRIIVCDDDTEDAYFTKKCLEHLLNLKGMTFQIEICLDTVNLLDKCENIDFLFLDMEIQKMNGIDIGLKLRTLKNKCHIIITSHFQKYLVDGYLIKADRYILKPFTQDQFDFILNPVFDEYLDENRYFIDEKIPGKKLYFQDIYYVEYSRKHTYLYTTDRIIKTPYSLSFWCEKLNNESFSQCYKSILVNLRKIKFIDKQDVVLESGITLPVSRFYKKTFEQDWIREMSKRG